MFTNLATQLAREQQRRMLAEASQRQRHQHGYLAPAAPSAATRIIRSLATAITRIGAAAAQSPGASLPARPRLLGEPAAPAQTPDRSH